MNVFNNFIIISSEVAEEGIRLCKRNAHGPLHFLDERFTSCIPILIAMPVENVILGMLPAVITRTTIKIDDPKTTWIRAELANFIVPNLNKLIYLLFKRANSF